MIGIFWRDQPQIILGEPRCQPMAALLNSLEPTQRRLQGWELGCCSEFCCLSLSAVPNHRLSLARALHGGGQKKTNHPPHTKRAPKLPSSPQEMKREGRGGSPLRLCTIYLEPKADGNAGFTRHTHTPPLCKSALNFTFHLVQCWFQRRQENL